MVPEEYNKRLEEIFVRFPSVQKVGFAAGYKPGLQHMLDFAQLLASPQLQYRTVHVAGTNGKGSVANMLASALAASGLKVGLYTSPHILDFRERMRVIDGRKGSDRSSLISRESVWDFICKWERTFDELDLSFFEITTGLAFLWFAQEQVDVAVIEVGLGGRLDSTNIIIPDLSVITSIGLDHCAMLGDTRALIAGEKAGIFKPGVPALVGVRDDETAPVFERVASEVDALLTFADDYPLSAAELDLLSRLDLQGEYQKDNLRTALCALRLLGVDPSFDALEHTAARMDFHGRWEMLRRSPDVICDIGHNPPALSRNFAQLDACLDSGQYSDIIILYGVMADKDLDGIIPLMPLRARYITVAPQGQRAMSEGELHRRCLEGLCARGVDAGRVISGGTVSEGLAKALEMASGEPGTLIYVGGSTFVVSEAVQYFDAL